MMVVYKAEFTQETDGRYTVKIPALDAITCADDIESAAEMAAVLIRDVIEVLVEDNAKIPSSDSFRSNGILLAVDINIDEARRGEKWLSTKEASTFLGHDPAYMRQLAIKGTLRARKRGRDWEFALSSLTARKNLKIKPGPKAASTRL